MATYTQEAQMSKGTPPAYESTIMTSNIPPSFTNTPTDAPPPSFDSLYGRVKAAKQQSEGNVDFCKKFMMIICGTIGCTIMLAFVLAIPITMIVMGNVWIYRTNGEWSKDPTQANYCEPSLYWFAFWLTTAKYILMGIICCCICLGVILSACCGAANPS